MTDEAEAAQEEYAPETPAPETPSEDDFSADDLFDANGNPQDEPAPEQVEPVEEPEPVAAYPQEAGEQPEDLTKGQTDVYEEPAPKEFAEAEPPQDEIADAPEETAVQKPALPVEDADESPLPPQEDEEPPLPPDEPEASPAPFDIFASEDDAPDGEPPLPPENDDAPSAPEDFAEAAQEQGEPEKPAEVQPASFWDEAQTGQSEEPPAPPAMTAGTDELLSFLQVADETSLSPALPPQQPEASAHAMKNTLNLAVSPLALGTSEFHPFETQSQNFVPEISKRPVALFGLTDFQDG